MINIVFRKRAFNVLVLSLFALLLTTAATSSPSTRSLYIEPQSSISETIHRITDKNDHWYYYAVAMEPNNGMPCCLTSGTESVCNLDDRTNSWSTSVNKPDNSKVLNVYFKVEGGVPSDLFLAGSECKVDAGNNAISALNGVANKQSISFLSGLADSGNHNSQITRKALVAIALHQGQYAHRALEKFTYSKNDKLKYDSIFWLGQARNTAGYESLLTIVDDNGRDDNTRIKAVFALSVNSDEKASEKLVQLAKDNRNEKVQSESVFWLAQSHKSKANDAINYILKNSENDRVRKKAVFSLSQIKTQASWQRLIEIAQTANDDVSLQKEAIFWLSQNEEENPVAILSALAKGKNPESVKKGAVFALAQLKSSQSTPALTALIETTTEKSVKKEALFWLGQSQDPKALDYIERLLTANL